MTSFRDDYVLGRGFQATTRLNLQHYIWKDTTGYLVHPSISLDKQDLKVADVGTGTGIWLLDLARILPYSARLNGYDITLAQCPVKEWLPPNVTFSTLDAFAEIPEHLIGQYDVVHVKLIILVVKDNDPTILLQNLMKMLKPGGYLQWAEYDTDTTQPVLARPSCTMKSLLAIQQIVHRTAAAKDQRFRPKELNQVFKKCGLGDVRIDRHPTALSFMAYQQDIILGAWEEICFSAFNPNDEGGSERLDLLRGAVQELRNGATWNMDRVTAIGKKAF